MCLKSSLNGDFRKVGRPVYKKKTVSILYFKKYQLKPKFVFLINFYLLPLCIVFTVIFKKKFLHEGFDIKKSLSRLFQVYILHLIKCGLCRGP